LVTDTPTRVTYTCNGSLQQFSFSFPIIVSSDLVVTLLNTVTNTATVLTETTHYAVTDSNGVSGVLANYANGGFVTTTIVPPYSSTYRITVERSVPYTQAADFTEGMQTLYETFEKALDKLTMQVQQLKDRVNRSPYVPIVDSTSLDMELPNSGDRANKYFGFNANGEPIAASITTTDLMVSAFGQNIVQATNAAAARVTLDFSAAVSAELLDEDNFASDSATKAPTQQSVKAYVNERVPPGSMRDWPTETPPTGWLERNGASLLIADYPNLYAVIGKMYGSVDANHFNLMDDRGLFPRWWDHGAGVDPDAGSRTKPAATGATISDGDHVGTEQVDETKAHNHTASASTSVGAEGAHTHPISVMSLGDGTAIVRAGDGSGNGATKYTGAGSSHSHSASTSVTVDNSTGSETRPRNRAYMPIIKY
jgi:microcystin-dependent protein